MLRSIRELRNIGCFVNARAPQLQFEPLTFIYGENCYGKSTLCEVFRSLAESRPDYIENRMTVPNIDNSTQRVHISFSIPGVAREQPFIFDHVQWSTTLPVNLRLLVYDSNFIHRNIFTGLTIDRGNQENITRFILGEEGTQTATTITTLNARIRAANKDISELEGTAFQGITGIEPFTRMQVTETLEEIESRIQDLTTLLSDQRTLQQNHGDIVKRGVPVPINITTDFGGFVIEVNECLCSNFQQVHDATLKRIRQHIENCTQSPITTETWISQGLELLVDHVCPFCGQKFNEQANELLDMYHNYFDDAFKRFVSDASSDLEGFENRINSFQCIDVLNVVQQNTIILRQYPELSRNVENAQNIEALETKVEDIKVKLEQWLQEYQVIGALLSVRIREKRGAIYTATNPWECTSPITVFNDLTKLCSEYNELLIVIIDAINTFKNNLDQDAIASRIQELEAGISQLNLQCKRLNLNDACTRHINLVNLKKDLGAELREQQQLLEQNQTQFINNYFDQINTLFSTLGSRNFRLAHRLSRRGHMPTLELSASYAGVDISQDRLYAFFSESDKRALALSIFLAKVESLTPEQKEQTILVLDDPITSFDDGRIDRSLRLMDRIRNEVRQIIILSHYPTYLKRFFDRGRVKNTTREVKLICIRQNENGSYFDEAQTADFVETAQQIKFRHIINFIERRHREDICGDLRIFLENEVKSRYYMQIVQSLLSESQFSDLITRLSNQGIIEFETYRQLNDFRISLNPDHHIWTGRNQEDKITLAADVLNFIYESL